MTINWRQRAPILRVLAAVYAELGEEAFKGRYGRIAKLYGNEATYDAIKSFFAKEIVKMAEDLKVRNSGGEEGPNGILLGQRTSARPRPLHLAFDEHDDDVIVMGEREVQVEDGSSQPAGTAVQRRARYESFDDGYDFNARACGSNGFHAVNSGKLPSVTPGASSRARGQKQAFEASPEKKASSRKRPHSVLEEAVDVPPSFGYITNQGKHRCALCMTELPDAEILRKHETASKLHLANLEDPIVVSRGCVTLAQVTSLAESAPRLQNRPKSASLRLDSSGERDGFMVSHQYDRREQSSTPFGLSISIVSEEENDTTLDTVRVAEQHSTHTGRLLPINGTADSRNGETGPAPGIGGPQRSATERGKARAQTVPRDLAAATITTTGRPFQPNVGKERSVQHPGPPTVVRSSDPGDIGPEDIQPTLLAQLLLSSGMELLAKKCIEEHPELRAGFYKCIQEMQGSGSLEAGERPKRVRQVGAE